MKKLLVIIVSLLALFVIGMIGSVILFKGMTEKVSSNTITVDESAVVAGKKISVVEVRQAIGDVEVKPSADEDISVQLTGRLSENYKDKFKLEVKESSNHVKIMVINDTKWLDLIGSNTVDLNLEIKLPEKIYDSIEIEGNIGEVQINKLRAKEMSLENDIGEIRAESSEVKEKLSLRTNIGGVELKKTKAAQIKIKSDTGEIRAEEIEAENSVIQTNLGSIHLHHITGALEAKSDLGDIQIMNKTLNGDIKAETSNGDVKIGFAKKPDSLLLHYQSDIGDGDIDYEGLVYEEKTDKMIKGKLGDGKILIDVRTKLGDFSLR